MKINELLILLAVFNIVYSASQVANFPVIPDMKSGQHKLVLRSLTGPGSTSLLQSYRSSSFQVVFSSIPHVAISLLVFQALPSADTVSFYTYISQIKLANFISVVEVHSGTIINELRYMYIAFPKQKDYGEIYFIQQYQNLTAFTGTPNTIIQSLHSYSSAYDLSHSNLFTPFLASFSIQQINNDYSVRVESYSNSTTEFKTTVESNSTLLSVNFFVIFVDITKLQATVEFYFDVGFTYGKNSQTVESVLDIPLSSFNYFNFIQGANFVAFSKQTTLSVNFNGNPLSTLGTFKYARSNRIHWRQRDCTSLRYYLHAQSKCYSDCPVRFANNGTQNYCQACHYSCLNCLSTSNGNICTQCSPSNSADQLVDVNRDLINGSCICVDGFYDPGVEKCELCIYQCDTCQSTASFCLTCDSSRELTNGSCPCLPRKYDIGSSNVCNNCHYTCLTCENSSNLCITCNTTAHRQLTSNNQCLCSSGFSDTNSAEQCTENSQLVCSITCRTCQNTSTACSSCPPAVNRKLNATSSLCSCITGYQSVNNALKCSQICGDGSVYENQCDDGNTVDGDGCSSTCTIQNNYACNNSVTPSVCIFQLGYNVTLGSIQKDKQSNTLYFKFTIVPAPPSSTVPSIEVVSSSAQTSSSSSKLSLKVGTSSLQAVSYQFINTLLSMTLQYSQSIPQLTYARLSLNQTSASVSLANSSQFQIVSDDGLALNYYETSTYTIYQAQTILIWTLIAIMWLFAIIFIILHKQCLLKIIQLFISVGCAWIGSMGLYRYLIYYEPIINFRYLFGYNIIVSGEDGLLAYVNYCLILNAIPCLIFVGAVTASKISSSISLTQLTKKYYLIQLNYAWLCFNSVIVMFGLFTQSFSQTFSTPLSIGSLIVGITYLILLLLMSIFMIMNQQSFMYFKQQMNLERRKGPIFFVLVLILKLACIELYLLLGYYSISARKYTPLIFAGVSLITIVLALIIRPYSNSIRVLLNELSLMFVFLCYFMIKQVQNADWGGFVIVLLLYIQVLCNYIAIAINVKNSRNKHDDDDDQQQYEEQMKYYQPNLGQNGIYGRSQHPQVGEFRFIDPKTDQIGSTLKKDQLYNNHRPQDMPAPDSSIRQKFDPQRNY